MRKLFAHNSHADTNSCEDALVERRTDGQSVYEVVDAVAKHDHPRNRRNHIVRILLELEHMVCPVTQLRLL